MDFAFETSTVVTLVLISTRVMAWALVAPPIATAGVSATVKGVLAVAMGFALVGVTRPEAPAMELLPILGSLVTQFLIGITLGFLTRLLFAAIETAGGLFDLFGGFALSQAYDPLTTTMTTILGKLYAVLATTLIFATNAHLLIFGGFIRSFTAVPLSAPMVWDQVGSTLAYATSEMFLAALQIAGPLIVVLFVADIGLGVLNRIAPQLNAFTMSFPVKIGLTLILVGIGLVALPGAVTSLAERSNSLISVVFG